MTKSPDHHPEVPSEIPTGPDVNIEFDGLEQRDHLGSGGTADVVKMAVPRSESTIAVKQPRLDGTLSSEVVDRFVSEAETWSKLDDDKHVVDVLDWGKTPMPWIALEYMDGGALSDRMDDLSIEEGIWIGVCAANAIWGAHRRGVAHLDLKPDNILFRKMGPTSWDVPKVSDWGLAKLLLHHSQSIEGLSPTYAAPEQFDADAYGSPDDISDIYQLGTIVYEILTGQPVFSGEATAVMNSHLTESPTPPTQVNKELPSTVDEVLGTALQKEKSDRYESILDFKRDLEEIFASVAFGENPKLICRSKTDRGSQNRAESVSKSAGARIGSNRDQDAKKYSDDGLRGGSAIADSSGGDRILDKVQAQSQSRHKKEVPWQEREDAPGIDRKSNARAGTQSSPDDKSTGSGSGTPSDDVSTSGDFLEDIELWQIGSVVGSLISIIALLDGSFRALGFGLMILVISVWTILGSV